ncbi:MAG: 2-deoxy-5-keto-D-gluconate 6-phosphate aldolase domain-containing protein [Candidatus Dormibacteria bacterium]
MGYDKPLFIVAFDHRESFKKDLFGIESTPTREEAARIRDAKRVIFEGLQLAVVGGVPLASAGALVDEEFGADIAREASAEGFTLAMSVEKSGQPEFDFEFGAEFGDHIERFDPTFAKVLVRYNPDANAELNRTQLSRLSQLSSWLRARGRRLLFELLIPAEPGQLESMGGDVDRYDLEIRPDLTLRTIVQAQAAGVEPDVWKIQGLDRREDCRRVSEQARSGGRDAVACIVLGHGASEAKVEHWLSEAAGVPGYVGFAVGRTIWSDALKDWLNDKLDRAAAARLIADRYRREFDVYAAAGQLARPDLGSRV